MLQNWPPEFSRVSDCLDRGRGKGDLHHISPLTVPDWSPPSLSPAEKGSPQSRAGVSENSCTARNLIFTIAAIQQGMLRWVTMKVIRGFMGWYAQLTVPQCDKIIDDPWSLSSRTVGNFKRVERHTAPTKCVLENVQQWSKMIKRKYYGNFFRVFLFYLLLLKPCHYLLILLVDKRRWHHGKTAIYLFWNKGKEHLIFLVNAWCNVQRKTKTWQLH